MKQPQIVHLLRRSHVQTAAAGLLALLLAACGSAATAPAGGATASASATDKPAAAPANGPAAGSAAPAAPADKQVLRLITANMPRSLDPVHIDAQRIIENAMAEPLAYQTLDGGVAPGLAKSWRNVEPALWEIELQPNVKFWSGAPLDAEAVKASLERHLKLNRRAASILNKVEYTVKGPLTLQLRTPTPDPGFIFKLVTLGIHNAPLADQIGDRANREPDLTGFMKPVEFTPGEFVAAQAWEGYWGEKPKLRRFEARLGADPQARYLAMKSGAADFDINIDVDRRKTYVDDKNFAFFNTAPATRVMWLNIKGVPALQDKRVRQALSLGIDREEFAKGVFRGFGVLPAGHFPAGLPYAIETRPESNAQKAAQLLDEAGWKPGPDGVRAKDGQPLHLKILTYSYQTASATAAQSQWKKIGVSSELNVVEITSSNQLMYDGKFDAATYCSCGAPTGDIAGQLRAFYGTEVVTNFGRYSNPEVDKLLTQLSAEFDPAKQFTVAKQLQQIVQDDVALIYLGNAEIFSVAYHKRVQGVDPNRARNVVASMFIAQEC